MEELITDITPQPLSYASASLSRRGGEKLNG